MGKILKSRVFLVIITMILTLGTTVGAAILYEANQVSYTPQDSSWNVSTVEGALNNLYNKFNTINTEYSDYKTKIAEALTNKGIEASEEDDIETIVTNINNTQTGCLVYYLGTGTSFDIKSSFPNEYTNLTADNFIVETSSMSTGRQSAGSVNFYGSNGYFNSSGGTISKSYTDGVLQVSLSGLRVSASADGGSGSISTTYNFNSPKVYLVIGNIGTI